MRGFLLTTAALAIALPLGIAAPAAYADSTTMAAAQSTEIDAEKLIGRSIYNAEGEKVGDIESVILNKDGSVQYVIAGVGGFIGMGDKSVALGWEELTIADNGERVMASVTKEQLEGLPEHQYPESQQSGTVFSSDAPMPGYDATTTAETGTTPPAPATESGGSTGDKTADTGTKAETPSTDATGRTTTGTDMTDQTTAGSGAATGTITPTPPAGEAGSAGESTAEQSTGTSPETTAPAGGTTEAVVHAKDLIGLELRAANDESVGEISDVLMSSDGIAKGIVIDVGGFLGVGAKPIMLEWTSVQVTQDENGNVMAVADQTREQLEQMPEYEYEKTAAN